MFRQFAQNLQRVIQRRCFTVRTAEPRTPRIRIGRVVAITIAGGATALVANGYLKGRKRQKQINTFIENHCITIYNQKYKTKVHAIKHKKTFSNYDETVQKFSFGEPGKATAPVRTILCIGSSDEGRAFSVNVMVNMFCIINFTGIFGWVKELYKALSRECWKVNFLLVPRELDEHNQTRDELLKYLRAKTCNGLDRKVNSHQENLDRQVNSHQENMDRQVNSYKENMDRQVNSHQENMDRQVNSHQENMDRQVNSHQENMDRQVNSHQENMDRQVNSHQENMDRQVNSHQENMDRPG